MTTSDIARLRALAEKQSAAYSKMLEYGEGVGGLGVRHPEMFEDMLVWDDLSENGHADTVLDLLDELERLRAERKLLFRDDIGRIWERLPSGLLLLTEWDNSSAHTFEEVQEDFSPLTPWEPVTGDDNA